MEGQMEKTLYEKAIKKDKESKPLICKLRDGESLMRHMNDYDDVSVCFDTTANKYIIKAIKDLRHEIVMRAIEHVQSELKQARHNAADEARQILIGCGEEEKDIKPIPKENTYFVYRCKGCGAYMPKRSRHADAVGQKIWVCTKCGKGYTTLEEILHEVIETLSRRMIK